MELSKAILSRRSVRSFKPDRVSEDIIIKLIKAAAYAPSAGNCQPWHFYVIRDELVKNKIYEAACSQELISKAPVLLTVCMDLNENEKYGERGRKLYGIQDTAAAIQNILLSATDIGLGSCWCGDFDEDRLTEILNMDSKRIPVAIIAIGYAGFEPMAPKRKAVEEVITFVGEKGESKTQEQCEERKIEHCNMGETIFNDVNLGGAVFNDVNLYGVDISDANLEAGRIHNCRLSNLEIYDCYLEGMKINGINISDILKEK